MTQLVHKHSGHGPHVLLLLLFLISAFEVTPVRDIETLMNRIEDPVSGVTK